jgi:hypothetical protein
VFDLNLKTIEILRDASGSVLKIPRITEMNIALSCAVALPEINSIVITGGVPM